MYGSYAGDARTAQSLQSPHPQIKVGINGILDEDGDIAASKGISNVLYGKRVGSGAGTEPHGVKAGIEYRMDMAGAAHLHNDLHTQLTLHTQQPGYSFLTHAFKATGTRTRLPNASAEHTDTLNSQRCSRGHDLGFGLRTARAGDEVFRLAQSKGVRINGKKKGLKGNHFI